jgi:hypothetical protein
MGNHNAEARARALELCKPKTGKTYEELGHAVQTGVKYEQETRETHRSTADHLKHLAVGNCLRAADMEGLTVLLIAKGIITEQEYLDAILASAEREVELFEARANKAIGIIDPKLFRIRFA